MAKAHIKLKSGADVTIEGTSDEVAELLAKLEGEGDKPVRKPAEKVEKSVARGGKSKPSLPDLIAELIDGGFFKEPRELGAIKAAFQEQGHFYPVTTLSPLLLRLVRRRELRRIKDKKRWAYVA